jgi:asparagine synthase (glutamine-hydrolysing)
MCGLTLYITKNQEDDRKLNDTNHRGPDHTIIHKFKHKNYFISIAFHRLAIIDLKHGDQPFFYNDDEIDRQVYLICNGEIYNYKKLIKNFGLTTKSDCHVILDLYLKYGAEYTVDKLEGEFAFIILDIHKDNLNIIYCRDRFGIRPLFYYENLNNYYFSSELKGLPFNGKGKQVEPRIIYTIKNGQPISTPYYKIGKNINDNINSNFSSLLSKIKKTLIKSVKDRMVSERPLGCLLSGGLDSSLISGIAAQILKEQGKRLTTFSIGMTTDSTDIINARHVASHINSIHHEIIIPPEKWIESLKDVIKQIETYDITTIRASTGQYLLGKWISENTDIKVILNGDLSDELTSGYLYFFNAQNGDISHDENIRLLKNIHNYDVLRVDRCISAFGLECRVPFACHHFVDLYLSIDKNLRYPIKGERIEKFLLRKAFDDDITPIIPNHILYRQKEAFSDGCSSLSKSWFEYIQEYIETQLSDEEYQKINIRNFMRFPSKESAWYYLIFKTFYPNSTLEVEYWMPQWVKNEHKGDPSARKLKSIY